MLDTEQVIEENHHSSLSSESACADVDMPSYDFKARRDVQLPSTSQRPSSHGSDSKVSVSLPPFTRKVLFGRYEALMAAC